MKTPAFATVPPLAGTVRVFLIERMAAYAVRLAKVLANGALATVEVLLAGNGFKMGGVDAGAVATQVIDVQAVGDGTNRQFMGNTMGVGCRVSIAAQEYPVAVRLLVGQPDPALAEIGAVGRNWAILVNFRPESILERHALRFHRMYGAVCLAFQAFNFQPARLARPAPLTLVPVEVSDRLLDAAAVADLRRPIAVPEWLRLRRLCRFLLGPFDSPQFGVARLAASALNAAIQQGERIKWTGSETA